MPTPLAVTAPGATSIRVGLELHGTEALIEGHPEALGLDEVTLRTPSLFPEGARATIVITAPGALPVVGTVEIVEQTVLPDEVEVDCRARFVTLTDANRVRLATLLGPST